MSADESKRTYKTSAIQRAIELVAKAKEVTDADIWSDDPRSLVRELKASARKPNERAGSPKTWRAASRKVKRRARDVNFSWLIAIALREHRRKGGETDVISRRFAALHPDRVERPPRRWHSPFTTRSTH